MSGRTSKLSAWSACALAVLVFVGAMMAAASSAMAQATFPDKPIRLIVPQAPGSATDSLARMVAAELAPIIGQSIVIENKPGAAFTLGLDLVPRPRRTVTRWEWALWARSQSVPTWSQRCPTTSCVTSSRSHC